MRKRKSVKKPMDAERTGEVTGLMDTPTGVSRAPRTGVADLNVVMPPKPQLISSVFGPAYLNRRSRPISADAIQVHMEVWNHQVTGYNPLNSPTPTLPAYDGVSTLLENWYDHARTQAKLAMKYKHTPTALNDTGLFKAYLNASFYAIANLTVLFNASNLALYNEAFGSSGLTKHLPKKRARLTRLWTRANAVPTLNLTRSHALMCGSIYSDPQTAPIVRVWSSANFRSALYGPIGQPTLLGTTLPHVWFATEATLDQWIDNIESAIQVMEGYADSGLGANVQADCLAIRDLIDMIRDIQPTIWVPGQLPDPKNLPGVTNSPLLRSELFGRGFHFYDTVGLSNDRYVIFPCQSMGDLASKIPVPGWGPIDQLYAFTLLGATKLGHMNDTDDTYSTDTANPCAFFGTDIPYGSYHKTDTYTREDGWVTGLSSVTDFGDGGDVRDLMKIAGYMLGHVYSPFGFFLGQYESNAEAFDLKNLDNLNSEWCVYVDEDDLGENFTFMMSEALSVPWIQ